MNSNNIKLALGDFYYSIAKPEIWFRLALQEIKQRYRRSVIGPFWITLSTAVMILLMGPLYSSIFNLEVGRYYKYISIGLVMWGFVTTSINESCLAFIDSEGLIKQVKLPFVVHVLKVLTKNLLLMAHNSLVILITFVIFIPPSINFSILLSILGFIFLILNLLWIGLLMATICARYRDIPPIVSSLLQVLFFVTPIIWEAGVFPGRRLIIHLNPVYYFIDSVRSPLLGNYPDPLCWIVIPSITFFGFIFTFFIFAKFRSKISYWI